MKLIIGNKAYSSWSLRGALALELAGTPYEETLVKLNQPDTRQLLPALGSFKPTFLLAVPRAQRCPVNALSAPGLQQQSSPYAASFLIGCSIEWSVYV